MGDRKYLSPIGFEMPSYNPFYTEWQECLKAHYQHVIRVDDQVTEPTLHGVLLDTGFTEDDIHRFRFEVLGEVAEIETSAEIAETAQVVEATEMMIVASVAESVAVEPPTPEPEPATPVAIVAPPEAPTPVIEPPATEPRPALPPKPPAQLSLF
jgi:hypothetical protein